MKTLFTLVMFLVGGVLLLFGGGAIIASQYGEVTTGVIWWAKVIALMAGGLGLMAVPHLKQIMDALATFVNNHATNFPHALPLPPAAVAINPEPTVPPAVPQKTQNVAPLMPTINGLVSPTQSQVSLQQFVTWEVQVLTHLIQAYDKNPELKKAAVNLLTTSINSHFLPEEGTPNHAYGS